MMALTVGECFVHYYLLTKKLSLSLSMTNGVAFSMYAWRTNTDKELGNLFFTLLFQKTAAGSKRQPIILNLSKLLFSFAVLKGHKRQELSMSFARVTPNTIY